MKSAYHQTWGWLSWAVEPAKSIHRQDERRQARLASTIQLLIIGVVIPAIFVFRQESILAADILVVVEILYIIAYGISRTHHYRIAAGLTVFLLAISPVIITLYGGQIAANDLSTIVVANCLALLVGSMFFSMPILFATAGFNLLILLPIVAGRGLDFLSLATPIILNVCLSAMIVVAANHRNQLEKDRLSELAGANRELEVMQARLEERVAERTQELQRAYENVQVEHERLLKSERMASLGRLTGGIAHEINTPLAASRAALVEINQLADEYLNSIGDPQVTPEDHREIGQEMLQSLKLAESSLERIAGFVRGIKVQIHDVVPRERILFNAVPVIQESLLLVNHGLRAANCTATLESPVESVELFGLPGQLSQVVTNLVTNAIDASAAKDAGLIALKLVPHAAGVDLLVSDQGDGIPAEIQPKIFDLFFTTKPTGLGTGLGLAIVRDIMTDVFAGTIDVASQVGQGTTFTLHFPDPGVNRIDT